MRARRWFPPGWPLAAFFVWYPLWWVLGITELVAFVTASAMALELIHLRRVRTPPGIALWLLFLVWVLAGVLVLQVNAPDAIPGGSSTRYLTWGVRVVWYLEATIVLLYVANMRKALTADRVSRVLSWMFVTTVVGGLLGSLVPSIPLHSLLDLVLPHGLRSNQFVISEIHPTLAERQDYLGVVQYRPSAPFPYANQWGLNFACLLPFFVHSWCTRSAGWRRYAAPVVLLVSLIPVIYSLNRGLWAALLVSAAFVAVKQAMAGRFKLLGIISAAAVAVVLVVAVSPLSGTLQSRFSGHNSNTGRTNLGVMSLESVASRSPILGFGTTRKVQGSFYSIAGGSSPSCPNCSPPAFGTQGFIWFIIFGEGFVGAFLCMAFLILQFFRHIRLRSPIGVACLVVLINFLLTLPVYDWSISAAFAVMTAIALMWRESTQPSLSGIQHGRVPTPALRDRRRRLSWLSPSVDPVSAGIMLTCVLLGIASAGVRELQQGPLVSATASLVLPAAPATTVDTGVEPVTVDTEAAFLSSAGVLHAIGTVIGHQVDADDSGLVVTARANTRVLTITYTSRDASQAQRVVTVALDTFLRERVQRVATQRAAELTGLREQVAGTGSALETTSEALSTLKGGGASAGLAGQHNLESLRYQLEYRLNQLEQQLGQTASEQSQPAQVAAPPSTYVEPGRWNLAFGNGLVLGCLVGTLLSLAWRRRGLRIATMRRPARGLALPVFTDRPRAGETDRYQLAAEWSRAGGANAFLTVDPRDDRATAAATRLEAVAPRASTRTGTGADASRVPGVMLVASGRTLADTVHDSRRRLEELGVRVVGLFVVEDRRFGWLWHPGTPEGSIL